jgi:hypothetical protein
MASRPRYHLVESRLAGAPAHREQLEQLLKASDDYWKAQTPVGYNPVSRFEIPVDGTRFATFELADRATLRDVETLLVVMAARMPGLSIEFRIDDSPGGMAGIRLVLGKLEAARNGPDGASTWGKIPHHSTLMGSK